MINTISEIEYQLDELFQNIIKLVPNNDLGMVSVKAKSISGLDFLMMNKEIGHIVLNQDAIFVLQWLSRKINTLDNIDLESAKSIFFLIGLVSNHIDFWSCFKFDNDKVKDAFIHLSECMMNSVSSEICFNFMTDYHEQKHQESFKTLIAESNWSKIYSTYHRYHDVFKNSLGYNIRNALAVLYYFDIKSLRSILDFKHDIPFMWGIMSVLNKSQAMNIALETTNQTLKFCALSSVFPFPSKDSLNEHESSNLVQVFLDLMKDENLWSHWMKILNTYPLRYPYIQSSLGVALAQTTSDNALQTYFYKIDLHIVDFCDVSRVSVSNCLESFSQLADKEQQKSAWRVAFEIWDNWAFGIKEKDGHLFEIRASVLDYAITRYYLDCYDSEERKAMSNELLGRLHDIDNVWHQTPSKYTTYWYFYNSKLQPIYHADTVSKDASMHCLMQKNLYKHDYGIYENYIRYMLN